MPRGYNTKGGLNGHFNHADPKSTFLLSLFIFDCVLFLGMLTLKANFGMLFIALSNCLDGILRSMIPLNVLLSSTSRKLER